MSILPKMKIIQCPSPNHDERTLPINLLVLHYTGMDTGAAALERMCEAEAKVSAHYMVGEGGGITQLVPEARRAWHAGVSTWAGETNINSASIGIEIVNGGHDYGLPDFPDNQIEAVIALSRDIMKRHEIQPFDLVGHSDIAPSRKQDPGEKFPWERLASEGVGYWPTREGADIHSDAESGANRVLFEHGARDRGVSIVQSGLAFLGYHVEVNGVLDGVMAHVVSAFQRRYCPASIAGQIDVQTMEVLMQLTLHKKGPSKV